MKKINFTTLDIAGYLGVYRSTVANWVDQGKLKAFITPGAHRRINAHDLIDFLKKHNMPVPDEVLKVISPYNKRILIVDDDPKILKSIKEILQSLDVKNKIYVANNGFEAGQSFIQNNPDIIILDLKLPGINGFKVCKQIRKTNKKVYIIAITGYDNEENRDKIMAAGANCYLPKPVNINKLISIVKRLVNVS